MKRPVQLLFAPLMSLAFSGCFGPSSRSQVANQIQTPQEFPAYLWASQSIRVCWVNPDLAAAYTAVIQEAVIREYGRVGFDLRQGWTTCTPQELSDFPTSPLLRIRFDSDAPPPFGGSAAIGAIYGVLADIQLRADPKTHVDPYCHREPLACMQNWAIHEVGHTFGLGHSHQHPKAKVGEDFPYRLPVSIAQTDQAFRSVNYLGDYDPESIMSYLQPLSLTQLMPVDVRTLQALYRSPTVLLKGPSAESNGRFVRRLQLSVGTLVIPEKLDYLIDKPSHYRYQVRKLEEDCSKGDKYSPPFSLEVPIDVDVSKIFPDGTAIKVCVVGLGSHSMQPFESHTNLFWIVGDDLRKAYDFRGLVHLEQCSGALIRLEGSEPQDPAMAMTNAHCLGLLPGQVVRGQATEISLYPLDARGQSRYRQGDDTLTAVEIIYATLGGSDLALLKLNKSYGELQDHRFFTLASSPPAIGTTLDVLSSLYGEGFSCRIDHIAAELREGEGRFLHPMRYSPECQLFPGTSGSPVIDRATGKIVGINATGNERGEACTANNPCEVEHDGRIHYQKGFGYALQTAFLYKWFP